MTLYCWHRKGLQTGCSNFQSAAWSGCSWIGLNKGGMCPHHENMIVVIVMKLSTLKSFYSQLKWVGKKNQCWNLLQVTGLRSHI